MRNLKQLFVLALMLMMAGVMMAASSKKKEEPLFSKKYNNAKLEVVLKDICKKMKYQLICDSDIIDFNKPITATFKKQKVARVLRKVLDSDVEFKVQKQVLYIDKKRDPKVEYFRTAVSASEVVEQEDMTITVYQDTTYTVKQRYVNQKKPGVKKIPMDKKGFVDTSTFDRILVNDTTFKLTARRDTVRHEPVAKVDSTAVDNSESGKASDYMQAEKATTDKPQSRAERQRARDQQKAVQKLDKLMKRSVIWFDFDSAVPNLEPADIIDRIAEVLVKNPYQHINVDGHASKEGTYKYNQGLSERRAQAIVDLLLAKGVREVQIKSAGFSFSQTYVDDNGKVNDQAELDRRVEILPTDTGEQPAAEAAPAQRTDRSSRQRQSRR